VLGWWGIPWGPIYTVQVLLNNLRGGVKQTVGDLLAELKIPSEREVLAQRISKLTDR